MSEISRVALFGKLNPLLYKAVEGATVFCKLRGNPYVELVHWIAQILQTQDSDLHRIVRHFNIDASKLSADITDGARPAAARCHVDLGLFRAHRECDRARLDVRLADVQGRQVRGGYLMVGIVKTPSLRNVLYSISKEFEKVGIDALTDALSTIVKTSPESALGRARRHRTRRRDAGRGERARSRRRRWASRRRSRSSRSISPSARARARSIRWRRARTRSARSSTSSCGGGRTIRC